MLTVHSMEHDESECISEHFFVCVYSFKNLLALEGHPFSLLVKEAPLGGGRHRPSQSLWPNLNLDPWTKWDKASSSVTTGLPQTCLCWRPSEDLLLISSHLESLLNRHCQNLKNIGMFSALKVNTNKCHIFLIGPSGWRFLVKNGKNWALNNGPIHRVSPGYSVRYQGVQFNLW